jgi:hypothetical protein
VATCVDYLGGLGLPNTPASGTAAGAPGVDPAAAVATLDSVLGLLSRLNDRGPAIRL